MLHEISPHRFDNAYRYLLPSNEDAVLCYHEDSILTSQSRELAYPGIRELGLAQTEAEYLFSIDGKPHFLYACPDKSEVPGYRWLEIRELRWARPYELGYAGLTGHHLYRWYMTRRYCGACGTSTERDRKERMMVCPACGQKEYPTIMPAVIVGIVNGDSLLMTKYADRPSPNWALVAGFTEIGETLEQTVAREAFEETGLKVRNITYYKSQPWPFSGSLLAGFFAELDGEPNIVRDDRELAAAQFVERHEIDVIFDGRALTNEMITFFKEHGIQAAIRQDPLLQQPYRSMTA